MPSAATRPPRPSSSSTPSSSSGQGRNPAWGWPTANCPPATARPTWAKSLPATRPRCASTLGKPTRTRGPPRRKTTWGLRTPSCPPVIQRQICARPSPATRPPSKASPPCGWMGTLKPRHRTLRWSRMHWRGWTNLHNPAQRWSDQGALVKKMTPLRCPGLGPALARDRPPPQPGSRPAARRLGRPHHQAYMRARGAGPRPLLRPLPALRHSHRSCGRRRPRAGYHAPGPLDQPGDGRSLRPPRHHLAGVRRRLHGALSQLTCASSHIRVCPRHRNQRGGRCPMRTDRLETFTDRAEEVALFDSDLLRGRDPEKPWPLLPILTFIAPGGSGKSTLIEHLIERCSVDGKPALPYARLDFTVPWTPTNLLSILILLRHQFQLHSDEYREHLPLPRFAL